MDYTLKELLDIPRLHELLDSLDEIHSIPSAIIDTDGNILSATAWQDICTKFHRVNPTTEKMCIERDRQRGARLSDPAEHFICRCPLGLVDAALPIILEGRLLGNVFTGQFFTEPPDEEYFIQQAQQHGFDESDYLAALSDVPLFTEENLRKNLNFIHRLTQMLAEQGLQAKRQAEAEEGLRQSKEKYQHIFENLQEVYYEATLDGTILEVSPSVNSSFRYQREELIGTSLLDLYSDIEERDKLLSLLIAQGRVKDYEIHLKNKAGDELFCAITTLLLYDSQGAPVKMVGSIRDINESKRNEEAVRVKISESEVSLKLLKESEERFKALSDASFGGVIIHDQGLILDCNRGLSVITGFSNEELVGMNGLKLIASDSLDLVLHNIKIGYDQRYEVEGVRKDGSTYPLAIKGKNIPHQGREVRVIEFRDISERKQAEEKLKTEQFRLSEIIRGTNVGTWEWNVQTGEMIFNERWAEIIGYMLADLLPFSIETMRKHIHPDDVEKRSVLLEKHLNGELDYYEFECRMQHKDGRWVWVLAHGKVSSWTNDGKPLFLYGTLTDIDERKRIEEERLTIEKLDSVGTLAGGIAHDFNNILAGLYGNISLAKLKLAKDHPGFRFLNAAEKSMNRATLLTNQLLTFAKGGEPVTESLSLGSLVKEVVQFNLAGSNVKPIIVLEDNLWLAEVDQGQIQQVFGNLTINAKQAMPGGGYLHITLANVEVSNGNLLDLEGGRFIQVEVTDDGSGIAPEYLERIFDPYFTTKQAGSGLGLATIYSIINKHGGHISVASQLGQGTTFTLYLPTSGLMELPQSQSEVEHSPQEHPASILILDDDDAVRSTVMAMLEELNFLVATASAGQQALDFYQEALLAGEPFDLVVLDLTIPGGMGGLETARKILKVNPEAKLIVSSGYADDPVMANYAEYGFTDVVAKPYTLNTISAVLTQALKK